MYKLGYFVGVIFWEVVKAVIVILLVNLILRSLENRPVPLVIPRQRMRGFGKLVSNGR